jgi:hypothetical protein
MLAYDIIPLASKLALRKRFKICESALNKEKHSVARFVIPEE